MAEFLIGVLVGVTCVALGAVGATWAFERFNNERLELYRVLGRMERELDGQGIPEEEM